MHEKAISPRRYHKEKWGDGPWQNEPDRLEWKYNGFPCLLLRADMGDWCGYVAVPPGHAAYEKGYEDLDLSVHGGLTYAGHCQGHICHVPDPGEPDNVWWLGFDCGHYDDLVPGIQALTPDISYTWCKYKDVPYVKNQVNRLAIQLAAMRP
jgi:hypothetical protein